MGFFSTGCHILAVQLGSMRLLLLSTFVHRLWNEVISIFVDALISDSIPKGRRSEVFFTSRIVSNLSHLLTPLISFFTFWYVGLTMSHHTSVLTDTDIRDGRELDQENMQVDFWDPNVVKASLQCLTLFWLPQIFTLLAWSEVPPHSPPASPLLDPNRSPHEAQPISLSIGASDVTANHRLTTQMSEGAVRLSEVSEEKGQKFMCLTEGAIPWIVYLSSFAMMAGAGMTVRFLPLFMKTEFNLSPTSLSVLSTCVTITSTICVIALRHVARLLGRAHASLLFTTAGTLCFIALRGTHTTTLALFLYVIRGSLQNATGPIEKGLTMDYTSEANRGKWAAAHSLMSFVWSCSAWIGGHFADVGGYRHTFSVTAVLYVTARVVYIPLLFLVPMQVENEHPSDMGQQTPQAGMGQCLGCDRQIVK
eukprot:GHVN01036580.1.p1 GENE.GHVN01036580.1~~GHVN01036580.1.p1  ORF type:complete len:421 (+),score=48.72 GHVN01036580.1:627-1889(+)